MNNLVGQLQTLRDRPTRSMDEHEAKRTLARELVKHFDRVSVAQSWSRYIRAMIDCGNVDLPNAIY